MGRVLVITGGGRGIGAKVALAAARQGCRMALGYQKNRQRAEDILGWSLPPVVRRWAGVYSAATDTRVCFREEVEPGVMVVTGLAGRGMTLSPAIAEQTWAEVSR